MPRLLLVGGIFLGCLLFLLWRLWEVQVRHGHEHVRAIQRQSIRRIRLNPVRGRIVTADGTVLAGNRSVYDLVLHVSEMRRSGRRRETVHFILSQAFRLARLLRRPMLLTEQALEQHMRYAPAMPLTLFTRLHPAEVAHASELLPPVPGMELVRRTVRDYRFPGLATHVLGFTGRGEPADPPERRKYSYAPRELRGRNGLELTYDSELSGKGGSTMVRVDTLGFVHERIGTWRSPENGRDLILSLDLGAQESAELVLRGYRGALVLVDVRTGALAAMASAPSYDVSSLTRARYAELLNDADATPLVNRAVSAGYTPGSILKPLIALAALEAGALSPDQAFVCSGAYTIGDVAIRCWQRAGHGSLDVIEALRESCNPFFIHAALATGLDEIQPMLAAAGIGRRPGIDLPFAGNGLLPSRTVAVRLWGRPWIAIDTAYLSIGQGAISLSPLQAAMYAAAIANGGALLRPYLVAAIRSPAGFICQRTAPVVERRLPASDQSLALIRQGMIEAVSAVQGTAAAARNPAITLAGKTGTAEVGSGDTRRKDTWFIGYGPVREPAYALAIVIESGASGGRTAAPLARRFFTAWLGGADGPPRHDKLLDEH